MRISVKEYVEKKLNKGPVEFIPNEKDQKMENARLISLFILIFFTVVVMTYIFKNTSEIGKGFYEDTVVEMDNLFHVELGDGRAEFDTKLPCNINGHKGEPIVITADIHPSNLKGNAIIFYQYHSTVNLYVDGVLADKSGKDQNIGFASPASRWYFARVPSDVETCNIRIEIIPFFEDYAKTLPTIYFGVKTAFLYMIMGQGITGLIAGILSAVIGMVLLISACFVRYRKLAKRTLWLGFWAIGLGIWLCTESGISQIFVGRPTMVSFISFAVFFALPVMALGYLLTYDFYEEKKYMRILFYTSLTIWLLGMVLQHTQIAYYMDIVWLVHVQLIAIVLAMIICLIEMKQKGYEGEEYIVFYGMMLVGACLILDTVRMYLMPAEAPLKYSQLGIVFFIAYLTFSIERLISNSQMEEVYRELAFKDIMTGLNNRTAFERKIKDLKEKDSANIIFLVMDVNGLKYINDTYGHSAGDDAILRASNLLKHCFPRKGPFGECSSYRIGGDEFCVIIENFKGEVFELYQQNLSNVMMKMSKETVYPFAIAYGYSSTKDCNYDLDETFRAADLKMYYKKQQMKVIR